MNNKYDLVIFDVDGTLLDTAKGVLNAVKYTIQKMEYEMPDENTLMKFIGPPIQESFANVYGLHGSILQEIAVVFRERYREVNLFEAAPYEGIFQVLQTLTERKVILAAATYKREDYAEALLKYFGFERYLPIIFGADQENRLKKSDIIEKCIQESGVSDHSRIVMVGDTKYDAQGAGRKQIDFIGVTYGFEFRTADDVRAAGAVGCAKTPLDILHYLETG